MWTACVSNKASARTTRAEGAAAPMAIRLGDVDLSRRAPGEKVAIAALLQGGGILLRGRLSSSAGESRFMTEEAAGRSRGSAQVSVVPVVARVLAAAKGGGPSQCDSAGCGGN